MKRPPPFITTFEDAPFWDYCSKQKLHLQRCTDCNKFWWPIGPVCPVCMGDSYDWSPVKGEGKITNYVVYHKVYYPEFEGRTPYLVAEIGLPEGVRLVGNVEGIKDLRDRNAIVGAPVQLYFEECNDGLKIPQWRIAK
jgi:uncharacterized OB-fold protein